MVADTRDIFSLAPPYVHATTLYNERLSHNTKEGMKYIIYHEKNTVYIYIYIYI